MSVELPVEIYEWSAKNGVLKMSVWVPALGLKKAVFFREGVWHSREFDRSGDDDNTIEDQKLLTKLALEDPELGSFAQALGVV